MKVYGLYYNHGENHAMLDAAPLAVLESAVAEYSTSYKLLGTEVSRANWLEQARIIISLKKQGLLP